MRPKLYLVVLSLLVALTTACGGTPVKPAPLPTQKQQALKCALMGSWHHATIDGKPFNDADISWTFKSDGTGVYHQTVPTIGMHAQHGFNWTLKGRNIYLKSSGHTTVYRADAWKGPKMKWFNYRGSNEYGLTRMGSAPAGANCSGK